jgi:hypothetical protein
MWILNFTNRIQNKIDEIFCNHIIVMYTVNYKNNALFFFIIFSHTHKQSIKIFRTVARFFFGIALFLRVIWKLEKLIPYNFFATEECLQILGL